MSKLAEAIQHVAPKCNVVYLDGFRNNVGAFDQYAVNTPMREAQFAAQFLVETGGGTLLQESGNYKTAARIVEIFGPGKHSARIGLEEAKGLVGKPEALFERAYGLGNPHKALELGNAKPGDGYYFRGIGPIQSTGRAAAKRWGDACGVSFEDDVLRMLAPQFVMLPPLMEWKAGKLNDFADRHDLVHIRRVINGGYNGLADCEKWFDVIWPLLKSADAPAEAWLAAVPDSTTKQIQLMLNQLGASPVLRIDGKNGPATKAAVKWFQGLNEIKADGIAGLVTVQTMRLRLQGYHVPEAQDLAA